MSPCGRILCSDIRFVDDWWCSDGVFISYKDMAICSMKTVIKSTGLTTDAYVINYTLVDPVRYS